MNATLKKSNAKNKKFAMVFTDKDGHKKTVNFGDTRYQSFTQHHSKERQKNYLQRHAKDPTNMDSPGELSRIILWSSPSLNQAIKNYEAKHNIKIRRE